MNASCYEFVNRTILGKEVKGKAVLEVGARNVNGSVKPIVQGFKPRLYTGVDIEAGDDVDQIVDAVDLIKTFGEESFDVVISTEALEHIQAWRETIHNLKAVLKPGGVLFITTRSKGFPYHGWPSDFWRYEVADMQVIFDDFEILALESDPSEPGVFLKARKPDDFLEDDLSGYELYPIQGGSVAGETAQPGSNVPDVPTEDKPPHQWGIA